MKSRRLISSAAAVMLLVSSLSVAAASADDRLDVTALYKHKDIDTIWAPDEAVAINLDELSESQLTITQKGDYVLAGSLNGQVVIEAPEDGKVRLILAGVSISSPSGPAIYEKQADKLIITLAEGTENSLTDGEMITDEDDTIGAALYAEDDLSINGSGSLTAAGTQKHGIQSKADLIIAGGSISVRSANDGIRGRNSVLILDGSIQIASGGDGITATRDDREDKGWVVLAGGNISITTGSGAGEAVQTSKSKGHGGWSSRGVSTSASTSTVSQKAVKAAASLYMLDGICEINSADDGFHANIVTIKGGQLSILSGDDGVHADSTLTVNSSDIEIRQCYEGLEGMDVTINGGRISIIASDDGVNASGGNDGSGLTGGRGMDRFSGSSGTMTIAGGSLQVEAGGDALDSNGSIAITGGVLCIWSATTTGEGAVDFNGSGTVTGGTAIIASTGGVMRDTAGLSGQSMMAVSATGTVGSEISLLDAGGNTLASFSLQNAFDTLLVTSDQLPEGAAFSIVCGDQTLYSGTMANNLNSAGFGNGGFENDGFGHGRNNRRGW